MCVEEIDAHREAVFQEWSEWMQDLMQEQAAWVESSHEDIQPVVQSVAGPWLRKVLIDAGMEPEKAENLTADLHDGFWLAGQMPPCEVEETVRVAKDVPVGDSEQRLRESIPSSNEDVWSRLRSMEFAEDLLEQTWLDSEQGWMSEPMVVEEPLKDGLMTRRLPVREWRDGKGWRTRVVDHATESGLNPETAVVHAPQHDTLDVLIWIIFRFMQAGVVGAMYKRDVSKAFRRLPVRWSLYCRGWASRKWL